MPSNSNSTKKKRKAAKKKKKKLLGTKSITINSPTNSSPDDMKAQESELICTEEGVSSFGVVSESKSMEGSGNEPLVEETKNKEVVEAQAPVEVLENNDSLKEEGETTVEVVKENDSLKEEGESSELVEQNDSSKESVEKVVSLITEVVHHVPVEKVVSVYDENVEVVRTGVSGAIEKIHKESEVGKDKVSGVVESVSRDFKDKLVVLLDQSHGTEDVKGSDSVENSGNQESDNVHLGPLTLQRTTWKSCCGLFDVLSGSNR